MNALDDCGKEWNSVQQTPLRQWLTRRADKYKPSQEAIKAGHDTPQNWEYVILVIVSLLTIGGVIAFFVTH